MNRNDANFLKSVDNEKNRTTYVRIAILDKLEKPIKSIEGRVQSGSSISLNGSSSMRRTCTLNFIADEDETNVADINNYLSINKLVKLETGLKYNLDYNKDIIYCDTLPQTGEVGKVYVTKNFTYHYWDNNSFIQIDSIFDYDNVVIWFPQGIFAITQPTITHNLSGIFISLNLKDKMCLLNGEMGGGLPTSITFHEYDQMIGEYDCERTPPWEVEGITFNEYTVYKYDAAPIGGEPNYLYYQWDREYGWKESSASVIGTIISIPQLFYDIIYSVVVRFGNIPTSKVIINDVPREIKQLVRWVGSKPLYFNTKEGKYFTDEYQKTSNEDIYRTFEFNDDVGYVYTPFTYPGQLISNIGDTVCSVLDKIIASLGNYEYFFDIDGNFVFQEKRNYLNTSYLPIEVKYNTQSFYIENSSKEYNGEVITLDNNSLKIIGKENYKADFYGDQKSVYNFDRDCELINSYTNNPFYTNVKNDYHIWGKNNDGYAIHYHLVIKEPPKPSEWVDEDGTMVLKFPAHEIVFERSDDGKFNGQIRKPLSGEQSVQYRANDWRAELYLQGLDIQYAGGRPDIYQQELLDLFDAIYEWCYYNVNQEFIPHGRFKSNMILRPNDLQYFLDYLEPTNNLYSVDVDNIGIKMFSYQQDKIIRLYDNEVPDYIMIDLSMDPIYAQEVREKAAAEGQRFSNIDPAIFASIAIGTKGYSAQEVVRDYLYQHTNYNETIGLQCIPIHYLDVNKRITVKDKGSNINGDFIINSITLPLEGNSLMNISASRALNKLPMNYAGDDEISAEFDNSKMIIRDDDFEFIGNEPYALRDNEGNLSEFSDGSGNKLIEFVVSGS